MHRKVERERLPAEFENQTSGRCHEAAEAAGRAQTADSVASRSAVSGVHPSDRTSASGTASGCRVRRATGGGSTVVGSRAALVQPVRGLEVEPYFRAGAEGF